MKKGVFCLVLFFTIFLMFPGCRQSKPSEDKNASDLKDAISGAILSQNASSYLCGECRAEGHILLTSEEKDGNTICYVIASYGEYGFEDGNFIKVSGSGAIPCRITFDENMKVTEFKYPDDGAMYEKSIRKIFGTHYKSLEAFSLKDGNLGYDKLLDQEKVYAKAYLEKIGREDSPIGEYADFDHKLLTDEGVSVEVSNNLLSDKRLGDYPYWIGNREAIEAGERYVYETSLDKSSGEIIYRKYSYNDGKTIEEIRFDLNSGLEIAE